jgi:uroporphyrinogen-III synthase
MSGYDKEKTYALFDSPFNQKRIAEIEQAIIFPQITTLEIDYDDSPLQNLAGFDWLIFPDVYAVEYFVGALEKLGVDLYELDALRVLAYGEAVADRLRFSQLHADVIPSSIKTSDVWQALEDYIFEEFDHLIFLVLQERTAKIEIVEKLPRVTELPIYSAEIADETQIPKLKALLKGGAIDEFIFSSHYDVLNLAQIFQTENLAELLEGIELTATDNLTLQSLQEFRLIEK